MQERTSISTTGMALRVVGGIGVGIGILTSAVPVIILGAVVTLVGHVLYRRGKDS